MLDFHLWCAVIVPGSDAGCAHKRFTSSDYGGVFSSDQFSLFAPLFFYICSLNTSTTSGKKRIRQKKTSHIWQTTFELKFLQKCCLSTSQLCTQIVKLWFSRFFHRKINPQKIVRYIDNSWENLPIKDNDHRVAFKAESCQKQLQIPKFEI